MKAETIRAILLSPDDALRGLLRDAVQAVERLTIRAEIAIPFESLGEAETIRIQRIAPDLLVLDLGERPEIGIRFAKYMSGLDPSACIVGIGPPLSPDLLLQAMRSGVREYLPQPVTAEAAADAMRRLCQRIVTRELRPEQQRQPGNAVALFGAVGGAGTTTVACNLAAAAARLGGDKRVLLVDADPEFGDVGLHFALEGRFGWMDIVRNLHRMDRELLDSYVERHHSGLHILAAPFAIGGGEAAPPEQVTAALETLKQEYDLVVLDLPHTMGQEVLALLQSADRVLLVATPDLSSIRHLRRCRSIFDRISAGDTSRVEVLLNRADDAEPVKEDDFTAALGYTIAYRVPADRATTRHALTEARPWALDRSGPLACDIERFLSTRMEIGGPDDEAPRPRFTVRGLFARLSLSKPAQMAAHG